MQGGDHRSTPFALRWPLQGPIGYSRTRQRAGRVKGSTKSSVAHQGVICSPALAAARSVATRTGRGGGIRHGKATWLLPLICPRRTECGGWSRPKEMDRATPTNYPQNARGPQQNVCFVTVSLVHCAAPPAPHCAFPINSERHLAHHIHRAHEISIRRTHTHTYSSVCACTYGASSSSVAASNVQ